MDHLVLAAGLKPFACLRAGRHGGIDAVCSKGADND